MEIKDEFFGQPKMFSIWQLFCSYTKYQKIGKMIPKFFFTTVHKLEKVMQNMISA